MAGQPASHRVTATLTEDEFQVVSYWAKRHGCSINAYFHDAILLAIQRENRDYDLPVLEAQRLNQVIDALKVLSENVGSLEGVVVSGFDSLLGLTRGDNYLLEPEDGDL